MGVVQPTLSLLPPSRVQLEQGSATLLCVASGGFPADWKLGWKVGGSSRSGGGSDSQGVLGKDGHYSWSSALSLPADQWRKAGSVSCEASKNGQHACHSKPESWPVFRVERLQHRSPVEYKHPLTRLLYICLSEVALQLVMLYINITCL